MYGWDSQKEVKMMALGHYDTVLWPVPNSLEVK